MMIICQWTWDVEFLVYHLGRHAHSLIKDKYLTEARWVILYVSLMSHRNEKKHHTGERETAGIAKVTWIAITAQC